MPTHCHRHTPTDVQAKLSAQAFSLGSIRTAGTGSAHVARSLERDRQVLFMVSASMCYTETAAPTRHRPERQHNARANRRKQCSPNETKPYSKPTLPRKRQARMLDEKLPSERSNCRVRTSSVPVHTGAVRYETHAKANLTTENKIGRIREHATAC